MGTTEAAYFDRYKYRGGRSLDMASGKIMEEPL